VNLIREIVKSKVVTAIAKSNNNKNSCVICGLPIKKDNFCEHHYSAYIKLKEKYNEWAKAYLNLSFEKYIKKVISIETTGKWIKEVGEYLLKSGGVDEN